MVPATGRTMEVGQPTYMSLGGSAVAVLVLVNGNHKVEGEGKASQIDFLVLISLRYSSGI